MVVGAQRKECTALVCCLKKTKSLQPWGGCRCWKGWPGKGGGREVSDVKRVTPKGQTGAKADVTCGSA